MTPLLELGAIGCAPKKSRETRRTSKSLIAKSKSRARIISLGQKRGRIFKCSGRRVPRGAVYLEQEGDKPYTVPWMYTSSCATSGLDLCNRSVYVCVCTHTHVHTSDYITESQIARISIMMTMLPQKERKQREREDDQSKW